VDYLYQLHHLKNHKPIKFHLVLNQLEAVIINL